MLFWSVIFLYCRKWGSRIETLVIDAIHTIVLRCGTYEELVQVLRFLCVYHGLVPEGCGFLSKQVLNCIVLSQADWISWLSWSLVPEGCGFRANRFWILHCLVSDFVNFVWNGDLMCRRVGLNVAGQKWETLIPFFSWTTFHVSHQADFPKE